MPYPTRTWAAVATPTSSCIQAAKDAGADTINTWSGGGRMDIQVDYGEDWIFGSWLALESTWCRAVYEACAPVR